MNTIKQIAKNRAHYITVWIFIFIISFFIMKGSKLPEYSFKNELCIDNWGDYVISSNNIDLLDGNTVTVSGDDAYVVLNFSGIMQQKIDVFRLEITDRNSGITVYTADDNYIFADKTAVTVPQESEDVFDIQNDSNACWLRINCEDGMSIKRIVILQGGQRSGENMLMICFVAVAVSSMFCLLMGIIPGFSGKMSAIFAGGLDRIGTIKGHGKKIIKHTIIVIFLIICAFLAELVLCGLGITTVFKTGRVCLYINILISIYVIVVFRNRIYEKAHYVFFLLAILLGITSVVVLPKSVGESWDDQIHYERAVNLSYGMKGMVTGSDYKCIHNNMNMAFYAKDYLCSEEGRDEWDSALNNESYVTVSSNESYLAMSTVAYIPSAIGLALFRGMGCNYTTSFMAGKFFNLFLYAALISIAIKMLKKNGRLLLMVIGLIPTNIFIASSYSYDYWMTAFIAWGFALAASQLNNDGKIKTSRWVCAACLIAVGCMPKAVYLFLLFPLLFADGNRFENKKECVMARAVVVGLMFLLVASFIMPMLVGGAGEGDARGGAAVDPSGQIRFILTNPVRYALIVLDYLGSFLSFDYLAPFLNSLAYIGDIEGYVYIAVMIGIVAVLDNGRANKCDIKFKITFWLGILGTLLLVVTALYISFCSVGGGIMGVQPRYLWCLLFPILYFGIDIKSIVPYFQLQTTRILPIIVLITFPMIFYVGLLEFCLV